MDRRSWPWKKKSSEKTVAAVPADLGNAATKNTEEQEPPKEVVKYVQVTEERYAHLSSLVDEVKVLNEKLSASQAEVATKDGLVKQHTKVAEEAVSGWEKAEAEANSLKTQLESVTLLKLSAEERSTHLDGALKECMKQIRNVKEESEQKLHDVVFAKTKQWEKVKYELEAKMDAFEQELLRSSAENDALSRSLQERSNMIAKLSEEKSCAEEEIEILKTNIQSCEKEINSLKYELHIVAKELEIRNEEKNMTARSAEVANKQHLEDVKKITKLEAECQRLRTLVRKKLPGPAALAQMKQEVESLGRDYGDVRQRKSPGKNSSLIMGPSSDFAIESIQNYQKENEFLAARLLATEEETNMLKEALSKRNSELQTARNMFSKTASKLRSVEAQLQIMNQQKSPSKSGVDVTSDRTFNQYDSNPPSVATMSEDGVDEDVGGSESWATALMSELSHFKKEKDDKSSKADSSNHLELMDDFLEMEKLACMSTETSTAIPNGSENQVKPENTVVSPAIDGTKDVKPLNGEQTTADLPTNHVATVVDAPGQESLVDEIQASMIKLQSKITLLFESEGKDNNMELLEDVNCIVLDIQRKLHQKIDVSSEAEAEPQTIDVSIDQSHSHKETVDADGMGKSTDMKPSVSENLKNAISHIHDFVLSLGSSFDGDTIEEFSSLVNKALSSDLNVDDFIVMLSSILSRAKEVGSRFFCKDNEVESNNSDCVDKVTLLENKVVKEEHGKDRFPESSGDTEILQGGSCPDFELKYSISEFEELKEEKNNLVSDLARCTESLEQTKRKLIDTEQQLEDIKSQLDACKKSNSLTETQLKCMAESYRSLESRAHELENEITLLRTKTEALEDELDEERHAHQEALVKCKDLQEQAERTSTCLKCSLSSEAEMEEKTKQEKEIAAAAEKLAECQETIMLLGKQLNSMRPQAEFGLSPNNRPSFGYDFQDDAYASPGTNLGGRSPLQLEHMTMDSALSNLQRSGAESPFDGYGTQFGSPDGEGFAVPKSPISSKPPKHRSARSSSYSPMEEKQGRGLTRFFSKGKASH